MTMFPLCVDSGPDPDSALACWHILWFMNVAPWEQKQHSGRSWPLVLALPQTHLDASNNLSSLWASVYPSESDGFGCSPSRILQLWHTTTQAKSKILLTLPYPSSNAFFAISLQEPWVSHPPLLVWGSAVYRLEVWSLESDKRAPIQTPRLISYMALASYLAFLSPNLQKWAY